MGTLALIAANVYVIFFNMSLGPGDVGDAGRDVPQPDPRFRAGRGGPCPMGSELSRRPELPGHGGRAGPCRHLRLYTAAAVISFFLVRSFIQETKGKELEQMPG